MEQKEQTKQTEQVKQQSQDPRKDFTGAKNLAHITLTLNEDGQCGIHWKGTTLQLADILYTTMLHDRKLAALICQAGKDYIETLKGDPGKWGQLTIDVAGIQDELKHQYVRHPLINGKPTTDKSNTNENKEPQS